MRKNKFVKIILMLVAVLCFMIVPACASGNTNPPSTDGDDDNGGTTTVEYYDDMKTGMKGVNFNGVLTENCWTTNNLFEKTVDGVSIKVTSNFMTGGVSFGGEITTDSLYLNEDNLENSSALKMAILSNQENPVFYNLTILTNGKNRLELDGEKIESNDKLVATKVENGKMSIEVFLPWSALGYGTHHNLTNPEIPVFVDFTFVKPLNASCMSSKIVEFGGTSAYVKGDVSTYNTFINNTGYYDYEEESELIVFNKYSLDYSMGDKILTNLTEREKILPLKSFEDAQSKVKTLIKLNGNSIDAGIVYNGEYKVGIIGSGASFNITGINQNLALTQTQVDLLKTTGLAIYTAVVDGNINLYVSDGTYPNLVGSLALGEEVSSVALYTSSKNSFIDTSAGVNAVEVIVNDTSLVIERGNYVIGGDVIMRVTAQSNIKSLTANQIAQTPNGSICVIKLSNHDKMYVSIDVEYFVGNVNLLVKWKVGAGTATIIGEGTTITITNGVNTFDGTADENGYVSFENVPYGIYTVSCDGYKTNTTNIDNNGNGSIVLEYDLFDEEGVDWTVSADQKTFYMNAKKYDKLPLNVKSDNFIMKYNVSARNPMSSPNYNNFTTTEYLTNSGLFVYNADDTDKYFSIGFLIWYDLNGEVSYGHSASMKTQGYMSYSYVMDDERINTFYSGVGINVMIEKNGNYFNVFVRNTLGVYELAYTIKAPYDNYEMYFGYWDNPVAKYSNFSYEETSLNYILESEVCASTYDGEIHGTVTHKTNAKLGEEIEIVFTPDDGYVLSQVIFNGEDITRTIENNTITLDTLSYIENNLIVKYEKILEISGTVEAESGISLTGRRLTLKYTDGIPVEYETIVGEGNVYTISGALPYGNYYINCYGAGATNVFINNDTIVNNEFDIVLYDVEYTPSSAISTQGEYFYVEGERGQSIRFNSVEHITYAEMYVYNSLTTNGGNLPVPSNEQGLTTMRLANDKGVSVAAFGTVYSPNSNDVRLRFNNIKWDHYVLNANQKNLYNTTGLKIAVAVTYDTIYGFADDGTGNLIVMGQATNPADNRIVRISHIHSETTYDKISHLRTSTCYEIENQVVASENGTVEVKASTLGKIVALVNANDGYSVKAITINDVDVTEYFDGEILTYKYNSFEKAVIKVEYQTAYTISGVLSGYNGNNEFILSKDTIVKLVSATNTYQTRVGDNGDYSFRNIVAGDYTIYIGNVTHGITVNENNLSADYTIEFTISADPYALTYVNANTENFDEEKYYSNLDVIVNVPDPAVLYVSDENSEFYGEYFLYGTTLTNKGFNAFRSKDLVNWEFSSRCFDVSNGWEESDLWAPEVIYEPNDDRAKFGLGEGKGVYYFFYSATTHADNNNSCCLGLGVSTSPNGPFVRYVGYDSLGRYIDRNRPWSTSVKVNEVMMEKYGVSGTHNIDPHPFTDPETGVRHLYMTNVKACTFIDNDWSQIDYDSFELLVVANNNVPSKEDADKIGVTFESYRTRTNEGPQVTYHNGKYYMTISINGYNDVGYSVLQLVADDPMGPFRKLKPSEGGIFLSAVYGDGLTAQLGDEEVVIQNLSGPGHHYMIEVNGELYVAYHRHIYTNDGNGNFVHDIPSGDYKTRYYAIDKVEWVTNSNGLEVMTVFGPTSSVKNRIYGAKGVIYDDIISDATVTVSGGTGASNLTDNRLLVYDAESDFIKEFTADDSVTITIDFDDYRAISGLMIYNSKYYEKMVKSIKRIEFDTYFGTAFVDNLAFPSEYYNDEKQALYQASPFVLDFEEMMVNEIRIEIELPSGQTEFALNELVVLGIPR